MYSYSALSNVLILILSFEQCTHTHTQLWAMYSYSAITNVLVLVLYMWTCTWPQVCIQHESNLLTYWTDNKWKFPQLAAMSHWLLCIPASSAPVERIFSTAGKMMHPDLARLVDQQLMFVKCNAHLLWGVNCVTQWMTLQSCSCSRLVGLVRFGTYWFE